MLEVGSGYSRRGRKNPERKSDESKRKVDEKRTVRKDCSRVYKHACKGGNQVQETSARIHCPSATVLHI